MRPVSSSSSFTRQQRPQPSQSDSHSSAVISSSVFSRQKGLCAGMAEQYHAWCVFTRLPAGVAGPRRSCARMGKHRIIGGLKRRAAGVIAALLPALAAPAALCADAKAVFVGAFENPLYIASAPGQPRLLFIVEQPGRIQVLRDERKLDHAFLDISGLISFGGER